MSVDDTGPLNLELPVSLLDAVAERVAAIVLEHLQTSSEHRWLTVNQAADYLGRTPEAIRGLVKRSELAGYKPDGRLQFDRQELDRWMRGAVNA